MYYYFILLSFAENTQQYSPIFATSFLRCAGQADIKTHTTVMWVTGSYCFHVGIRPTDLENGVVTTLYR